jgi:hypothetical protein
MFGSCRCVDARDGVFVLAFCIYAAVCSPVFLGSEFGPLLAAFIRTPLDPPLAFALWVTVVVGGVVLLAAGIRENLQDGHGAPVPSSLAAIAACAIAIHKHWYLPELHYLTRGFYVALIAASCANLCMAYAARVRRLRLDAPVHPQPAFGPDETVGYRDLFVAYAERDAEQLRQIEDLTAQLAGRRRNTNVTDTEQLAVEHRDMKALLVFPGARAALLHALHPDHHADAPARVRNARTDAVAKLVAVYQRIGTER